MSLELGLVSIQTGRKHPKGVAALIAEIKIAKSNLWRKKVDLLKERPMSTKLCLFVHKHFNWTC